MTAARSRPPRRRPELPAVVVACLIFVLGVAGAVLLFRVGVVPSDFPAFVAGDQKTVIYRYSGPWITAAAGSLVVALLAVVFVVLRLLGRRAPVPAS